MHQAEEDAGRAQVTVARPDFLLCNAPLNALLSALLNAVPNILLNALLSAPLLYSLRWSF